MPVSDVLRPDGSSFDPFLFAEVGKDGAGATVTVLSALARLGLEPWTEASALALLGRDAAQVRLQAHLASFRDVPALGDESGNVATRLVALLPKRVSHRASIPASSVKHSSYRMPFFWILAAVICILVIARI